MTKVLLYHPVIAADGREFDRDHADKLLAMTDNGGWYEKENSDNASNGTGNKRATKKAKASRIDKGSN